MPAIGRKIKSLFVKESKVVKTDAENSLKIAYTDIKNKV